jgi:uncharacterized membrane protein YccC
VSARGEGAGANWPDMAFEALEAENGRLREQLAAALARAETSARWSARWRSLADLYRTAARDYAGAHEAKMAALAAKGRAEGRLRALAEWAIEAGGWRLFYYAHESPPEAIFDMRDSFNPEVAAEPAEARGEPGGDSKGGE